MKVQIGAHSIVIEDDVLFAHVNNPWQLDEMRQFLALCEKTYARLGSVYLVTLVGPGYNLPPESRRYIAEWGRNHVVSGNVIVGAPFAMRALITVLSRAAKLFGGRSSDVEFTATELEARRWVAQRKAQRSASGTAHPSV